MTNQDEKSFSSHKILLEVVLCKGKKKPTFVKTVTFA